MTNVLLFLDMRRPLNIPLWIVCTCRIGSLVSLAPMLCWMLAIILLPSIITIITGSLRDWCKAFQIVILKAKRKECQVKKKLANIIPKWEYKLATILEMFEENSQNIERVKKSYVNATYEWVCPTATSFYSINFQSKVKHFLVFLGSILLISFPLRNAFSLSWRNQR